MVKLKLGRVFIAIIMVLTVTSCGGGKKASDKPMTLKVKKVDVNVQSSLISDITSIKTVDEKGNEVVFSGNMDKWFDNATVQQISSPENTKVSLDTDAKGQVLFRDGSPIMSLADNSIVTLKFNVNEKDYLIGVGTDTKFVVKKSENGKYTLLPEETAKLSPPSVAEEELTQGKVNTNPAELTQGKVNANPPELTEEELQEELTRTKQQISVAVQESPAADEQKSSTEEIYYHVEQMPQFPGGQEELMAYLSNNIKYPAIARDQSIQGRVAVRFVVHANGSISNVEVLRSLDPSCDKEAIRVIKSMPQWIPGKQNGKAVNVYYTLPVKFILPQ